MTATLTPAPATTRDRAPWTPWLLIAAATLAAAGVLHVAAAADHPEAPDRVVWFFLAVALGHGGGAVWFTVAAATRQRPGALPVVLATAATVGLVLLYLIGHTTNLLDGISGVAGAADAAAHAGHALRPDAEAGHPAGWLGTSTVTVELVLLLALTALLPARVRRIVVNGVLALGALAWAFWLLGLPG